MTEVLISLLALLVSMLAYWETKRQSSVSVRLSEQEIELVRQQLAANRQAAVQEKQANISAKMFKEGKAWKVRVFNSGPAEARNVRVVVDDTSHLVSKGAIDGKFPMDRMEKGQSVDFWALVHMQSPEKETVTILWDDSFARDRENRVEITI